MTKLILAAALVASLFTVDASTVGLSCAVTVVLTLQCKATQKMCCIRLDLLVSNLLLVS
jgi:hypothetical protein